MEEEGADHRPPSSSSGGRGFLSGLCAAALRRKPISAHAAHAASGEGLVRQLGVFELVLLGIGASIGAGIFVVTGTVARDAGPGQAQTPPLFFLARFGLESAVAVL
jgi:APA family basic amino acid/polyamine antiporter